MIDVSYHAAVNVLQERKLHTPGPFDRPEWFALLAKNKQTRPFIAIAQDNGTNDGAVAALVLKQIGRRLEPLTNWYSFIWRPLLSPGGDDPALLEALAQGLKGQARHIAFSSLPDEDGSASLVENAFRKSGWSVFRKPCDNNHILTVAGRSFAEYLASCPGQLRTTLKRKSKKINVELFNEFNDLAWQSYEEIYCDSWKPSEGNPALLKRFAQAEGAAGRARLALARHDGKAIAAQFWTVENGTAFIHKLAHRQNAQALSPGTTLTAALMEQVIDRDHVTLVDFGTGNDPYKRDWMDDVRPRFQIDCYNRRSLAVWPHIAKALIGRLASGFRAG